MRNTDFEGYFAPRRPRDEQLRRLRAAIEQELTPRQQCVLRAVYLENRTETDLARELGVNKSTVSRTLSRARDRLRRCLRY
ncbi:MAG: sigma-70 family RNA polymerase sigma factor [Oscillospiraceae bacterium]|nr:sigma-70 family RNA polymerase sigma factor [Oscillospiraceae bacterium]